MRAHLRIWIAVLSLTALSSYAWAHHAFSAEFDAKKPVKLRGNVTKMDWINPHAWIYMDVKGADGKVVSWMIELGPPNALLKRGWTKQSVPPGIEIIVDGYQAKDGALRANGRDVTLPNGTKLFAGSSNTGAPGEEPEK
ncbi:MAG TPA: DUF6152 family protein [Terriglobia bacterium]|nr:DUF6152 family protein [Terriglobia bacterium]